MYRINYLFLVILILMLSATLLNGCSLVSLQSRWRETESLDAEAKKFVPIENKALVYIVAKDFDHFDYFTWLDDKNQGELHPGGFYVWEVTPGQHRVYVSRSVETIIAHGSPIKNYKPITEREKMWGIPLTENLGFEIRAGRGYDYLDITPEAGKIIFLQIENVDRHRGVRLVKLDQENGKSVIKSFDRQKYILSNRVHPGERIFNKDASPTEIFKEVDNKYLRPAFFTSKNELNSGGMDILMNRKLDDGTYSVKYIGELGSFTLTTEPGNICENSNYIDYYVELGNDVEFKQYEGWFFRFSDCKLKEIHASKHTLPKSIRSKFGGTFQYIDDAFQK